jgi:hypothetical protein
MTERSPSRNRRNVLLFPGITGSKQDRPARPSGPARVIVLADRLTKRKPSAGEARPAAREEA